MHDIQHIHYPNFFSLKEKLVRKLYFSLTVKYVNYIQASSYFIKQDLLNNFKSLDEKQINVINEGVSVNNFTYFENITDIKKKYSIPNNYIFYPAQLWPHKNHITIIKAMGHLLKNKNTKIHLVLTGKNYGFYNNILKVAKKEKVTEQIFYLGLVPFEDLLALYKQARFVISAALYESSSLPILESFALGIPIIACDTPPNKELSMKLKIFYFPVLNFIKLSNIIQKEWNSKEKKKYKLINKNNIKNFDWTEVAKQYLNLFMKIKD